MGVRVPLVVACGSLPSWRGGPGRPELGAWARRCQRDTARPTTRTYSPAQLSPAPLEAAMSYTGSDDQPLCDGPCNRMCPPGWPDWFMPWAVPGPHLETGRVPSDQCDDFHLCRDCLQELVLSVPAPRRAGLGPPQPCPLAGQPGAASIRPRLSSAAAPPSTVIWPSGQWAPGRNRDAVAMTSGQLRVHDRHGGHQPLTLPRGEPADPVPAVDARLGP